MLHCLMMWRDRLFETAWSVESTLIDWYTAGQSRFTLIIMALAVDERVSV